MSDNLDLIRKYGRELERVRCFIAIKRGEMRIQYTRDYVQIEVRWLWAGLEHIVAERGQDEECAAREVWVRIREHVRHRRCGRDVDVKV